MKNAHICSRKYIFLGCVFIVVAVIILVVLQQGVEAESETIYHLPDEVPDFSVPEELENRSNGHKLDDIVVPYYDFLLEAGDATIEVSLPIIQADYGAEFNAAVVKQLENLVSNTMFYLERNELWVVKRLSYEAYLNQDILTVLIMTETDDQTRCEPWIFDLSNAGREIATSELVERLLGLDYATFLWITDRYIQNEFSATYQNKAYTSDGQDDALEAYRGILREIPYDLSNALNRTVFPSNSKVYLMFDLPQITDDWSVGFRATAKMVELDASILRYKDMVTPQEAVIDAVFNSTVHMMGGTDQAHAHLVRTIFHSEPVVFIDAVSGMSEQNQVYAIESLLRYADETNLNQILAVCSGLEESEVVNRITAEIKGQS